VIPKAEVLAVAEQSGLLATTIEKDYVLGWVLFAIAQHPELSAWIFKGGTCLKKCYFDTYRFSEDLDFTLPDDSPRDAIAEGLRAVGAWVSRETGIEVPDDGIEIEESVNKRGGRTYQAKLTYRGPLALRQQQRQRVKFDPTHHELVVGALAHRPVFHAYSDLPEPVPVVACYSLEEVLAEKTRALVQRSARARDVYDVVNIGRNFRAGVDVGRTRDLAVQKFAHKDLPAPTPELVVAAVQRDVLATDWENTLRHQLQVLPPVDEFFAALSEVLTWLLAPEHPVEVLPALPAKPGEELVPVVPFARLLVGRGGPVRVGRTPAAASAYSSRMDRVRYAARTASWPESTTTE
jgi:predicted nucleotidyltransferase component of viral defense system